LPPLIEVDDFLGAVLAVVGGGRIRQALPLKYLTEFNGQILFSHLVIEEDSSLMPLQD
jgi:hypothetical protein